MRATRRAIPALAVLFLAGCGLKTPATATSPPPEPAASAAPTVFPLSIEYLRQQTYDAEIRLVETLEPGGNYSRFIAAYESEGNTVYALLTIPDGEAPETGWPVIIFNHGYIPPAGYSPTVHYEEEMEAFASAGYILFRSDYRGHGRSEGVARGAFRFPDYVIDVLNGVAAMKRFPFADPERIGMWGHSMGGYVTLRALVVDPDIRAAVIWGGMLAPYDNPEKRWFLAAQRDFTAEFGSPEENPAFWSAISAHYYLADITGPLQLHHGTADHSVPSVISESLYARLLAAGQPAELYLYPNDNHNLTRDFDTAMARSLEFLYFHVKGGQ